MEQIKRKVIYLNKIILIVIILLAIFNSVAVAQPSNLSDRELLVQLYSKVEGIENSMNKIVDNSELVQRNIVNLDKRVTKNEINIDSFCESLDAIMKKWTILLSFFLTLLVGVIVSIIARFMNGRKVRT